ncbi:amidohydrolase family protein [Herbiconiux sp. KACC 21604]|uniref:amidohydrolase family protein n=1 Tax=unclassified Herbiconiux TaxID=2618217 RepID=UPI001491D423|nr:amidohydrolase family protein [Herbiconiux sp. SALV-R1]QJU55602.1 amidohydrolase family protein [Herbiconiux sp. SALV-R1]WPO86798.1 amidohydrolase family protein [Herbiconiux sp. KACC 21604]
MPAIPEVSSPGSRILIRGAAVATVDPVLGDLERADILIEGGRIAAVEPASRETGESILHTAGTDAGGTAEVIDASEMIAIPGMIDTHRHTWQAQLRGILADGTIPDYLRGMRLQMAIRYRPEDMYVGNYAGALDAINSGVTSIVDYCHNILDPECAHGAVTGLLDAGVRGLYGHGMTPVTSNTWSESAGGREGVADPAAFEPRARLAREIRDQYFRDENQPLRFGIAPQELPIAPVADVAAEFALARELGARMTMHANQLAVRQLFQDVKVLSEHGLLGPDLLLVHCSFNTPEEWELLRDTGTTVSICAETEMQMGMGFPTIREATEYTPGPGLGIDCVSGDSGDLLSHARLVLQATRWRDDSAGYEKLIAPQEMRWTTKDALRWITQNGAVAAGIGDEVGSLTPGKRADVVLLDMSGISQAGWNRRDPTGMAIAQTNSGNVDTVLIDGRVVKRHGRLVHVDVDAALARTRASHDYLYEQMDRHGGFIPQPPLDIPLYRERA